MAKNWLWPHNQHAVNIDVDYYKSLPHVPIVEGSPHYVKAFPFKVNSNDIPKLDRNTIIEIISQQFDTQAEAEHFAAAFIKHHRAIAEESGCIVYGKAHLYSIVANFDRKYGYFEFANWA